MKSKLLPGFILQRTLGTPESAARKLLDKTIAPEGSGREATLISARETNNGSNYEVNRSEYLKRREQFPNSTSQFKLTSSSLGELAFVFTAVALSPSPFFSPMYLLLSVQFEYTVKGPGFHNHTLSVVTFREKDNTLYTYTILTPVNLWPSRETTFRTSADSFRIER